MRLRTTEPGFKFKSSRAKHMLLTSKPTPFNTHLDKNMEPQLLQIHFYADPKGHRPHTLGALLCMNFCLKETTPRLFLKIWGLASPPKQEKVYLIRTQKLLIKSRQQQSACSLPTEAGLITAHTLDFSFRLTIPRMPGIETGGVLGQQS